MHRHICKRNVHHNLALAISMLAGNKKVKA